MTETYYFDESTSFTLSFYTEVMNMKQLRKIITERKISSLINPYFILEPFHLEAAVFRALSDQKHNTMTSHDIHTEILYSLHPKKQINEAVKTFGAYDHMTEIVVAKVYRVGEFTEELKVEGRLLPLSELSGHNDYQAIRRLYKVGERELSIGNLLDAVVNRIATKKIAPSMYMT